MTSPSETLQDNPRTVWGMLKPALIAFSILLFVSLLFLKPYLPKVVYYNFAKIDDYKHFVNREVRTGTPKPWEVALDPTINVNAELALLLSDIKTTALLIVRDGKIVYENYSDGGGEKVISGSFSAAKSIVGLLTGIAIQEKLIPSLDTQIIQYLPELGERPEGKITIKNLLTMSSGTNWEESVKNPLSATAEAYYGEDLYHTALKSRIMLEPGTQFSYKSGDTQLLSMALSRAVKSTLSAYASEKLWVPLGAETEALWSLDHFDGLEKAFCCFNATARDYARLGQLLLNNGKWNGKEILNQDYLRLMLTPNMILDQKGKPVNYYGFQWWILNLASGPIYYAWGYAGQYIIVNPAKHEVIVRLGRIEGKIIEHVPEEVRALAEEL